MSNEQKLATEQTVEKIGSPWLYWGKFKVAITFIILTFVLCIAYVTGSTIDDGLYTSLGVFAAIFANLSGAGGGIVFIPVFSMLGLTETQMVATSFGIQCFGMTAGAVTWSHHYCKGYRQANSWRAFIPIIILCSLTSIMGIWSVYGGVTGAPPNLHSFFSLFSIVLGISLLVQIFWLKNTSSYRTTLQKIDYGALLLIGYLGGVITAWLSVGVGEIVVLYLVFRRYDVTMSIAAAVVVTAITVWSASIEHHMLNDNAVWDIVMFAGPGAVIGGIVARSIAQKISVRTLKIILAVWILIAGLVG
jgi:uncharacterized membrane protein YfcA